jgi:hypothetical protein
MQEYMEKQKTINAAKRTSFIVCQLSFH